MALRATVPEGAAVQVFCSDLERAVRTARPIGGAFGVRPVQLPGLREMWFGEGEGKPQSWLDECFVPPSGEVDPLHDDGGIVGAETRAQLGARVYTAMEHVLAHSGAHAVVVTHGFAVTFVVAWWIGMPLSALGRVSVRATPGGITELAEDDVFGDRSIVRLNDVAHLLSL